MNNELQRRVAAGRLTGFQSIAAFGLTMHNLTVALCTALLVGMLANAAMAGLYVVAALALLAIRTTPEPLMATNDPGAPDKSGRSRRQVTAATSDINRL